MYSALLKSAEERGESAGIDGEVCDVAADSRRECHQRRCEWTLRVLKWTLSRVDVEDPRVKAQRGSV